MKGGDFMKTWPVFLGVVAALVIGGIALAQMPESGADVSVKDSSHTGCGRGMLEAGPKSSMGHTKAAGTTPCGMAGRGMMHSYFCCPVMTGHSSVEYFLSQSEAIELSDDQVKSLEAIRDSHQKQRIQEAADFEIAMLELDNLLSANEIDLEQANELNQRIESIRTRARFREIETFANAKRILNTDQLEKLKSFDTGSLQHERRHGMMNR